jgi:exopolysaccharide biosynthesis polyprenyl glycosylphosphotransferase
VDSSATTLLRKPDQALRPRSAMRLTPAQPAAVIIPAVVVGFVVATASGIAEVVQRPAGAGVMVPVAAAAFSLVVLIHAYAMRVLLWARMPRFQAERMLILLTMLLIVAFQAVTPGLSLHLITLLVIGVLSLAGMRLATWWRSLWFRNRPLRMSLLAPSEMAAQEALERFDRLPAVEVASVVIPGCEVERASRMLDRPVSHVVGGRLKLCERMVVSCPTPDARVSSTIAQLVALGHTITSETAAMRRAEGRVDSLRANALNLLMSVPRSRLGDFVRRVMDLLVSVVVLVVLAPLLLGVVIAIVVDSGFPILYRQGRVGRRGKLFQVLKFRTMCKDAEKMSGPVFAAQDDPRVTRVGKFLRHYRLDELPQLLNVLRGQMTLVGPRPERPHFFNVLRKDVPLFELRTFVKPGITGWAQIRLPYAADSHEARAKLEYDLYYVMNRSLWFDLAILLETARVVLSGDGSR